MIIHNQSRRSSVLTHASFYFHRDIHTIIRLSLITIPSLFVRMCMEYAQTEGKSKVHRYSQRLGAETEMSLSARTQTHTALLPALTTQWKEKRGEERVERARIH